MLVVRVWLLRSTATQVGEVFYGFEHYASYDQQITHDTSDTRGQYPFDKEYDKRFVG